MIRKQRMKNQTKAAARRLRLEAFALRSFRRSSPTETRNEQSSEAPDQLPLAQPTLPLLLRSAQLAHALTVARPAMEVTITSERQALDQKQNDEGRPGAHV